MSNFAVMDSKGIIQDSFSSEEDAINEIPTIRENNEIKGDILVIEILHYDN